MDSNYLAPDVLRQLSSLPRRPTESFALDFASAAPYALGGDRAYTEEAHDGTVEGLGHPQGVTMLGDVVVYSGTSELPEDGNARGPQLFGYKDGSFAVNYEIRHDGDHAGGLQALGDYLFVAVQDILAFSMGGDTWHGNKKPYHGPRLFTIPHYWLWRFRVSLTEAVAATKIVSGPWQDWYLVIATRRSARDYVFFLAETLTDDAFRVLHPRLSWTHALITLSKNTPNYSNINLIQEAGTGSLYLLCFARQDKRGAQCVDVYRVLGLDEARFGMWRSPVQLASATRKMFETHVADFSTAAGAIVDASGRLSIIATKRRRESRQAPVTFEVWK